jgi:hypothetical protein
MKYVTSGHGRFLIFTVLNGSNRANTTILYMFSSYMTGFVFITSKADLTRLYIYIPQSCPEIGDWARPLAASAASIDLRLLAISENDGLSDGSADQQASISALYVASHHLGTGGRRVLLTIPPIKLQLRFMRHQNPSTGNSNLSPSLYTHTTHI